MMFEDTFNFDKLVEKLNKKEKFDFSKWGDGEFNAVCQDTKSRQNCDGHIYFKEMGDRLKEILTSCPRYHLGLQSLAHRQRTRFIDDLTKNYELKWCDANFIHHASIRGNLNKLFEALKERKVLLVGPEHLKAIVQKEGWEQIVIPSKNCWEEYENIKKQIEEKISEDLVILYCASMTSEVLIDDFAGQATQIDMGSVLDPYAGLKTRTYHHNLEV